MWRHLTCPASCPNTASILASSIISSRPSDSRMYLTGRNRPHHRRVHHHAVAFPDQDPAVLHPDAPTENFETLAQLAVRQDPRVPDVAQHHRGDQEDQPGDGHQHRPGRPTRC